MRPIGAIAVLLVIGLGPVLRGNSQSSGCSVLNWPTLQQTDPAFADAIGLTRTLAAHRFVVQCVAPSTMTGTFEGQVGAALYSTDLGAFDALFLPETQSFDALDIVERHERGRFLYSFIGRPDPSPPNLIDAPDRVYFVKHVNRLLVIHQEALAARLAVVLGR